ncbi:MAG: hypothetical protein AB9856_01140 [Cellulosilyticaceae bacterium]
MSFRVADRSMDVAEVIGDLEAVNICCVVLETFVTNNTKLVEVIKKLKDCIREEGWTVVI